MRKFLLTKVATENKAHYVEEHEALEVSDGYHTMHELYEYRMALNVALCHAILAAIGANPDLAKEIVTFKSKLHSDGTMFDGYFVVMILFKGKQISNHYKMKHWDKFRVPEMPECPPYDGHNTQDCIERLLTL